MCLLLPLLLAALLPQGYMPAVEQDGTFTVTLCTSDGLRTVTLDADGDEIPDSSGEDEDGAFDLCIYSGLGQFATLQVVTDLPAVSAVATQKAWIALRAAPAGALRGRLGARAPPVLL